MRENQRYAEYKLSDSAATFLAADPSAPYCVEVLVHASAVTVRDHVGQWGTIEDREDGRCLLRMTSDSLDWPLMTLGSLGAEFTVVSPPELLEHVHEWGHRFGRATTP